MKSKTVNIPKLLEKYQIAGLSMATIEGAAIKRTEFFGFLEIGSNRKVESNSIFNACSISKFFTSILVMILAEKDILDLDKDINENLSSWKVPVKPSHRFITLRHLLSHQSGVVDPEGSFDVLNPLLGTPTMIEIVKGKTSYCHVPIQLKYEPGSEFHYSDAGYCIIQLLIEEITGKSFEAVMNDYLFQPLHLNNSTFELPENKHQFACGHSKRGESIKGRFPIYPYPAASGLWTTPTEVARLVIEIMKALKGESKCLSADIAQELMKSQGGKEWMGLGVFLDKPEKGIEISSLGWGVGFQCMVVAYPYKETGLVIMINTDPGVHQLKGIIGEVYRSYNSESSLLS
ncbi:penicillin-binding protein [Bacillus sp. AFS015802]|uniref:serine hydrolase domain-containing protein n=1 Tax=Bacillus sp. AFS015802 TaxID=2033486 RepID=UPI000BF7BAE6|nr:serine hydrolase domain-containing protein [Bacillus sp. AFS015802]PFA67147.1 penicillin-binding protein [Bacillus sp. AFS015802]